LSTNIKDSSTNIKDSSTNIKDSLLHCKKYLPYLPCPPCSLFSPCPLPQILLLLVILNTIN
jgi:hypothetical protein